MQGPTESQEAQGTRRNHRELPLWLPQKGLDNKGQQGSDGLGELTSGHSGMGLSLTDFFPTEDYGKEVTKSGPDKGSGCGWCGFLQASTF